MTPKTSTLLIVGFLVLNVIPAQTTVLGDLVKTMPINSLAELKTQNYTSEIYHEGNGTIYDYAENAYWDPGSEKLVFVGASHAGSSRLVIYDAKHNTWRVGPRCRDERMGHGYDAGAINKATGEYYHITYVAPEYIYKYDARNNLWSFFYATINYHVQPGVALEHFPELNSLVYVDGKYGTVMFLQLDPRRWIEFKQNVPMNGYHNIAEYSPGQKVMILGGGNSSRTIHRLDADKNLVQLKEAPMSLGCTTSKIATDPATGKFIVLGSTGFYTLDAINDQWQKLSPTPSAMVNELKTANVNLDVVVASVETYGVVIYLTTRANPKIMVYKHAHMELKNDKKVKSVNAGPVISCSPNPLNAEATIVVKIKGNGKQYTDISIRIYNMNGTLVKNLLPVTLYRLPSRLMARWNASSLPSGLYVARISINGRHQYYKNMLLVK